MSKGRPGKLDVKDEEHIPRIAEGFELPIVVCEAIRKGLAREAP